MKPLPNFGEPSRETRRCNYAPRMGPATDETACGRPAVVHVAWTPGLGRLSFLCERDVGAVLDGSRHFRFHPMGPSCGMPGSLFDPDANQCVMGEMQTAEERELSLAVNEEGGEG